MKMQHYGNHIKYYAPHHFIFLPLSGFLFIYGIIKSIRSETNRLEWILFSIVIFFIIYLAIMLRQHYALGNQDRIVRLEFRLRYYELFNRSAADVERNLRFDQIAALRFANDEEFKKLLQESLNQKVDGDTIKKKIKNWQADNMRV